MMEKTYPIKRSLVGYNTCYFPENYFRKWVLNKQFPQYVTLGQKQIRCTVAPHPDKKEEILVTEDIWTELGIPHNGPIHIFESGKVIHLGPLVGIFTAGFTEHTLRPMGKRTMLFSKLLNAEAKIGAFYFVFGAHHIDWERETIKAYFHTRKGWVLKTVPFPQVVYDRLPNRKTEILSNSVHVKNKLQNEYKIPWFNPGFFDKWTIHQLLENNVDIQHYLPESYLEPSNTDIEKLLQEYQHLYFKPSKGSLGLGIQQIIKPKNEDCYYCRFRTKDENRLRRYTSLGRLLERQFSRGLQNMLVQQGINLLTWQDKQIDFRVHTNKNLNGEWVASAIAAKIAGSGSVTTHVSNGGKVLSMQQLITEIGQDSTILQRLKNAAIKISMALDEKIEGNLGEIGFDLGVDHNQNIWLFEANSKPGRSIFSHPDLRNYDQLTRLLPLSYAFYLAKEAILQKDAVLT
jgi:hypothetical protein